MKFIAPIFIFLLTSCASVVENKENCLKEFSHGEEELFNKTFLSDENFLKVKNRKYFSLSNEALNTLKDELISKHSQVFGSQFVFEFGRSDPREKDSFFKARTVGFKCSTDQDFKLSNKDDFAIKALNKIHEPFYDAIFRVSSKIYSNQEDESNSPNGIIKRICQKHLNWKIHSQNLKNNGKDLVISRKNYAEGIDYYLKEIQELKKEYLAKTGKSFDLKSCQ